MYFTCLVDIGTRNREGARRTHRRKWTRRHRGCERVGMGQGFVQE